MASSYIKNLTFSYNFFLVAKKWSTPLLKIKNALTVTPNRICDSAKIIPALKQPIILSIYFLILIGNIGSAYAIDYYQRQSGNWNDPGTWTTLGNWQATVNTGTYPQAGDNVYLKNNGNPATITLTSNAACANLFFDNTGQGNIVMGNFNLIVSGSWTSDEGNTATISQGTNGYLQVNGGITNFKIAKTINNFRVGSSSFSFTQTNQVTLTVSSNYDYNCYQSTIPTGISANSANKLNISTSCNPTLTATTLTGFGPVCTNTTIGPNSFTINALSLTNANVTVGVLNGYTYSTSAGGTYTSTLSFSQPGGHYSQDVYVKFTPIDAVSYNGNIVVGGGGASAINVAVSGNGSGSVAPTVISPTSANIAATTATLGGNITVDGCSSQSITERGIYYSTTSGFANGTGTKVSETGTFGTGVFTISVTGLSTSTTFYYKAFAMNNGGTGYSSEGSFNNNPFTYYTRQSGNWTDPSSWSTTGCDGTTNSGTYPGYGDDVVICQPDIITVNSSGLSCKNINMSAYATQLVLNNDLLINGNLILGNQSVVSVGPYNLTIKGDFSNSTSPYNTKIDYSTGNISIGGNITVSKGGLEPFTCSGSGWLIMTGTSKTFNTDNAVSVPRFKQPLTGFTESGGGIFTIATVFDRNCGPAAPAGVSVSIPGNTLNSTCNPNKTFRSVISGSWTSTSTWQQSYDGGATWGNANTTPIFTDGSVTIQNIHTVTLNSNVGTSSLTVNGALNLNTYTLNGTNTFSMASGSTMLVNGKSNFPTGFSTVTLNSGSTVNFNKDSAQTVSPRIYSNLILSGSGAKTTTGVAVSGILSMEGTASATATIVPNVASTTLQFKGTAVQSIYDNFFLENKTYNLTIDNASGVTLNTDFTVNNNLIVNSGKFLTIQPAKTMNVKGNVTNNASSGIIIKASQTLANGSLIFHNTTNNPFATVEMYSKAFCNNQTSNPNSDYKWQYFGIPISSVTANPTFNGSYVRKWDESGSSSSNHWISLTSNSVLLPFNGYELTQKDATFIIFQGQLVNNNFNPVQLPYTSTALYPGQQIFANSYTTAIDIQQLSFNSQTEGTIYLYNSGSLNDWTNHGSGSSTNIGTNPGQYTAIPYQTAGSSGLPRQIPSMQGFLVKAMSNSPLATFGITYNSVVMNNTDPQRAPGTKSLSESNQVSTRIDLAGTTYSDRMWLFTDTGCTRYFDNGWDGAKIQGSAMTPQIFAVEPDGNYQVDAVDNINNTLLGFQAGEDVEYTLTFTHQNLKAGYTAMYLIDLVENRTVDITESGSMYAFVAVSTPESVNRFKIVTRNYEKDTPDAQTQLKIFGAGNTIFVQNLSNLSGELVLNDMMGHMLKRTAFGPFGVTAVQTGLIPGAYVVNAYTSTERVCKRIITGK